MYASTSQSDHELKKSLPEHQRVSAAAAVSFKAVGRHTKLDRLYQQGSAKIRFPKTDGTNIEAVLINTAGGLTGGDQLSWDLCLAENTEIVATTQACEKAYRSSGGTARMSTHLHLGAASRLHWLPQETILYDGCALSRTFEVTMERGSTLLALESIVLGREAMGETVKNCFFKDRWRVRRNGKLIFADDIKLEDSRDNLAEMHGNRALASLLFVSDLDDEQLRGLAGELREICPAKTSGFSAFNGKITGRVLADDSYKLRQALIPVLKILRGTDLPRVWRI